MLIFLCLSKGDNYLIFVIMQNTKKRIFKSRHDNLLLDIENEANDLRKIVFTFLPPHLLLKVRDLQTLVKIIKGT